MRWEPPYLWTAGPGPDAPIAIEYDVESSVAVLRVRGGWDGTLGHEVTVALHRCFAEEPGALIVDLLLLDDPNAQSIGAWLAAQDKAAEARPPVRLALCVSPELVLADRLQQLGARRFLPVYARVHQARVALAARHGRCGRLSFTLAPDGDAPGRAVELAQEACMTWELEQLAHPVRTVMAELVHNAVEHAGTAMTVALSRRAAGLTMAVSDGTPVLPRLLAPGVVRLGQTLPGRGRGLRLVHENTLGWGAMPTADGKVVWATVRGATGPR